MRTPGCAPRHKEGIAPMPKRRRSKQQLSLQDRLAAWAQNVRKQAEELPAGPEQDALLKKARQAETASHLEDWANSTGLQPPSWTSWNACRCWLCGLEERLRKTARCHSPGPTKHGKRRPRLYAPPLRSGAASKPQISNRLIPSEGQLIGRPVAFLACVHRLTLFASKISATLNMRPASVRT